MKYKDIIEQMERSGHYSEANNLRGSLSDSGMYDHDSVRSRHDAADGLPFSSYDASCAERAFDELNRRKDEQ